MYGVNIIESPSGVFNVTSAFGPSSPIFTHEWPRKDFTYKKKYFNKFHWSPIKDPQFGMGYEWEAHFEVAISIEAYWINVLMELDVPFDWISHSKLVEYRKESRAKYEQPLFNARPRSIQSPCPSSLRLDLKSCAHHLNNGCHMPWGSCRKSYRVIDQFRWPRCQSCPIPLVQDFKWDLNEQRLKKQLDLDKINKIAQRYGLNEDQLQPLRAGMRTDTPLGKFHQEHYVVVWERAVRDMQAARELFERDVGAHVA
jgi:hypothetical protein